MKTYQVASAIGVIVFLSCGEAEGQTTLTASTNFTCDSVDVGGGEIDATASGTLTSSGNSTLGERDGTITLDGTTINISRSGGSGTVNVGDSDDVIALDGTQMTMTGDTTTYDATWLSPGDPQQTISTLVVELDAGSTLTGDFSPAAGSQGQVAYVVNSTGFPITVTDGTMAPANTEVLSDGELMVIIYVNGRWMLDLD